MVGQEATRGTVRHVPIPFHKKVFKFAIRRSRGRLSAQSAAEFFRPKPNARAPPTVPTLFSLLPVSFMHFDAHQPVIDDLEARILTIRDSL